MILSLILGATRKEMAYQRRVWNDAADREAKRQRARERRAAAAKKAAQELSMFDVLVRGRTGESVLSNREATRRAVAIAEAEGELSFAHVVLLGITGEDIVRAKNRLRFENMRQAKNEWLDQHPEAVQDQLGDIPWWRTDQYINNARYHAWRLRDYYEDDVEG